MNNKTEFNVLVCGSQRFTEKSFVYKVLTAFYQRFPINNIVVSQTSGVCEFAHSWVENINPMLKEHGLNPIGVKTFNYDPVLEAHSCSVYEGNIPDFVFQNDKFFTEGRDEILKNNIQAILAIPNPEGILGASTLNIKRFAEMAGKKNVFFDCSQLHSILDQYHEIVGTTPEQLAQMDFQPKDPQTAPDEAFGNLKKSTYRPSR